MAYYHARASARTFFPMVYYFAIGGEKKKKKHFSVAYYFSLLSVKTFCFFVCFSHGVGSAPGKINNSRWY